MTDTTFVPRVTNINATWLNPINNAVYKGRNPNYAVTTGSANAQILTLATGSLYTSPADGDTFTFEAGFTNTAAMTLQIIAPSGTLPAVALQFDGSALSGGEIVAGMNYTVIRSGATWQLFTVGAAQIGTKLDATGAVARTQHGKNADIISLEDFGAVGDGVTDDSAAWQAAVNTGKPIRLANGLTYKVTEQIEVTENLWIEGNGAKVLHTPAGAFFLYNAAADAIDYFVIDGLTVETNAAPRTTTTSDVLRIYGASFVRIENCNLIGGNVRILSATEGGIVRNNRITGTNSAGDVTLAYGVYVALGKKYLVEGNTIDTFTTDGVKCAENTTTVPTPGYYRVIGNDISDCAQNGIDVYEAGRLSVIANNVIHGTCSSGLEIKSEPLGTPSAADNSNQVVVSGNVLSNTGALGALLAGSAYAFVGNVVVGAFSDSAARVGSAGDNTETATMRDIVISGNVMENTDSGNVLRIRQNKNNIVVTGNSFVGAASTTGTGVGVSDTEGGRVSITGNSFRSLHFGANFQTFSGAALSFTNNFLEDVDNVAQIVSGVADAWVCITGNIAKNVSSTPLTGTLHANYIIKDNSWQNAGPITIRASVGTTAGSAAETDFNSYSLQASTLQRTGQTLRITAWGNTANNANPKTVNLYFGTAAIQTTALTINQGSQWKVVGEVMMTGTDTQSYTSTLLQNGATPITDIEAGNATQDDGAAITIKVTGTVTDAGGGVLANDIQNLGLIVEPVNY